MFSGACFAEAEISAAAVHSVEHQNVRIKFAIQHGISKGEVIAAHVCSRMCSFDWDASEESGWAPAQGRSPHGA